MPLDIQRRLCGCTSNFGAARGLFQFAVCRSFCATILFHHFALHLQAGMREFPSLADTE